MSDPYHSSLRKSKCELHGRDISGEPWQLWHMVPLFLAIAALSLLFPDRAVVVCGLLMLTTWWRRLR
jgi:hypothetical protein